MDHRTCKERLVRARWMPWKAEGLAAVKLAAIFGAGTAGKAVDVQAECCTLDKECCPKIQHKNHLTGYKITLGSLNSCAFLMVTV